MLGGVGDNRFFEAMERRHLENREPCPLLPAVEEVLTAQVTAGFKRDYNVDFYRVSLRYAQSLWLEGCLLYTSPSPRD